MLTIDVFGKVLLRVKHIPPDEHDVVVLRDDLVTIVLHVVHMDAKLPRVLALAHKDVVRRIARSVHDGECRAGHRKQMALQFLGIRVRGLERVGRDNDVGHRFAVGDEIDGLSGQRAEREADTCANETDERRSHGGR